MATSLIDSASVVKNGPVFIISKEIHKFLSKGAKGLHSVQTVIFAGVKIWNLILQADMSAFSKSTAQVFVI